MIAINRAFRVTEILVQCYSPLWLLKEDGKCPSSLVVLGITLTSDVVDLNIDLFQLGGKRAISYW